MNNKQWIEGTPEPNELVGNVLKYYLVQDVWGDMHVAHYKGNNEWSLMDGNDNIYDVIAYQKLPPIYKSKENQ